MLELRCPAHPTYRALRKPKVDCSDCHELYALKRRVQESQDPAVVIRDVVVTHDGEIVDA